MQIKLNKFFSLLITIGLFIWADHLPQTNALIEDVIDVIHLTKEVAMGVLQAWHIVQQTNLVGNGVELPFIREKQKKVLRRMKELSRKIDQSESRYVSNIEWAIESINSYGKMNTRFELQMNEVSDIMNRIATRHSQMQRYEASQDKLEETTLVTFAEWSVSPNAYAINNLLEQLHLIFIGNEGDTRSPSKCLLDMFADMLERSKNTITMSVEAISSLYLFLFVVVALPATIFVGVEAKRNVALEVDTSHAEYITIEQALWKYISKPRITQEAQLKKVYDTHRSFVRENLHRLFDEGRYEIIQHSEWIMLKSDLMYVNSVFEAFRVFLDTNPRDGEYNEQAALDLCDNVLKNDETFSMEKIFNQIELIMVKQAMYYRALLDAKYHLSGTPQSPQQFLYSLYADVALTELKGYTMMQFSWMILRIYGKGNFTQESELMREDYAKRTERTLTKLREVMRRADRIVWRNDPNRHVKNVTYDEVTRLLQGYIENEVDMNPEETCREDCGFYESTKNYGCFKNKYCSRQKRCSGRIVNCQYFDSDMMICPAPSNSSRRYEYIEYENGRIFGLKKSCVRGTTKVDSWWRYLFWHCSYCFCMCDEPGMKSDRYFNLRETVSNVNENKVVTGLRFVKRKRVFHIQIQEGQLLPRGNINVSTLSWKPIDDYQVFDRDVRNGRDYHTLAWDQRAIDLDDIEGHDISHVVTGIRFRVVGTHLNLEAQLSEYSFEKGELVSPKTLSFWQSNDNTDVSGERRKQLRLTDPDVPTRSLVPSIPISNHNEYIEFTHSSLDRDAAQTTVPFIDIQEVTSIPPVPLSGVGLYLKGRNNYGGFIAPKLITYDFTPYVRMPSESPN